MVHRVLLVDDQDDIRSIAKLSLEAEGWTVTTTDNGHDGVALAASDEYDAIVVDVMMPGLDGEGTVRLLRAQPATADSTIVVMTATPELVSWEDELDIAGVLRKPFEPTALAANISRLCRW